MEFAGRVLAETRRARRIIETNSPPSYYVPALDVRRECLVPARHHTLCEWKGRADYWDVASGDRRATLAAWSYPRPRPAFEEIAGYFAFYAQAVDHCFVGEEEVIPQPGRYYGGWITANLTGPFKGVPGSEAW